MEKYGLYDSPSLVVDSVSDTSEEDSDDDNNGIRSAVSNILHPGKKNKNVIPRRIFEGTTDINEVGVKLQEYIKNLKQVTSTPVNIHVPNFQTSFKLSPIGRHRNSIISEHLVNVNSKLPNVTEKYKQATVPENDENIVRSVDPLNTHDRSKKENPEFNKQEHGKKSNKILPTNLVNIRGSDLQKPSSDKNWINTALSDLDCSVFIHSSIILKNGATTVNNNDQQQTLHITKATELSDRKLRSASNDTINKKPCCISDEAKINNKSKTVTKATIKNSKSVDVKKSSSNKIKYPLSDVNPHTGNHKPETTLRTYKTTAPDSSQNVTAKMTPVKDKTTATEFSQNISSDEVNEGEQLHCSTRKRNSAETLATQVTLRRSKRTASAISQDMPMDEVNACLRNSESDEQLSKNSGNPDGIISPEARDKRIMNKLSQNLSLSDVNAQVINFKPDKRLPNIQHSTLTTGTKLSSKTKVNDVSQNIPFNEVNASKPDEQLHHSSGTLKSAYVRISKCIKPPDLSRGNSDVILTSHQNMTVSEAKRDEVLHRNSNNSETISDTERTLIRDDGTSDLCQFVPLDEVNTHVRNLNPDEQLQCSSGNLDAIHTTVATSSKKTATNLSQNMTQSKVSARVKTSKLDRSSEISNVVATTLTTLRRDEKISDFSQNMPLGEVNTHKRNRKPDELLDCSRGKENSYAHETRSKGETNVTSKKQVKYKRFKQGASNTKKQRKEPESNTTQQTSYNESAWNQESGFSQSQDYANMTRSNGRLRRNVNVPKRLVQATFHHSSILKRISTRRESSYRTARERHTDPSNGKRTTGKGSQRSSANQTKKISNNNTNNRINLEAPEFHPDMDFNSNTTSTTTEELVSIPESTESNAEEDQFEIRRKPTKRKAKSPIPTSSLSQTTSPSSSKRTDQLLDVVVNNKESTESNAEEDQFEIRRKPTKRKAKSPIPTSSLSQTTPASPSMRTDQLLDVVVNIEGISTRRESTYKTSIERQTDLFNGGASANQTKKLSDNNTNNRINLEAPEFHPDMDLNYNTTSTTTEELVSIPESTESNAVGGQSEIRRKPTKRKAKPPIPTSSLSQTTSASSSMRTDQLLDVVVNNKETESNEVEGQFKVPRNPAQRKGKKRVPASSDLHQPSETIHTSSSMETDQLLDTVIHYEGNSCTNATINSTLDNFSSEDPVQSGISHENADAHQPDHISEGLINDPNSNKDYSKFRNTKTKEDFIPTIVNDRFVLLEWKSSEPVLNDSESFNVIYCLKNLKSHLGVGSCGYVVFAPGQEKKHVSKNQVLTFKIEKGRALVSVQLISTTMDVGSTFYIPLGTPYKIKNLSESEKLVLYFCKMSQM